jgi:hypothetical protein
MISLWITRVFEDDGQNPYVLVRNIYIYSTYNATNAIDIVCCNMTCLLVVLMALLVWVAFAELMLLIMQSTTIVLICNCHTNQHQDDNERLGDN